MCVTKLDRLCASLVFDALLVYAVVTERRDSFTCQVSTFEVKDSNHATTSCTGFGKLYDCVTYCNLFFVKFCIYLFCFAWKKQNFVKTYFVKILNIPHSPRNALGYNYTLGQNKNKYSFSQG